MLTCTSKLYTKNFIFCIFGTKKISTQVFQFLDKELENEKLNKKLISVLGAINTDPMEYNHPEKFKKLEEKVWEIKIHQLRIACVWDPKPKNLVGIYGFYKKKDKWDEKNLIKMRNQKEKYFSIRKIPIGDTNEWYSKISE